MSPPASPPPSPRLLAVPNFSEGRDRGVIDVIGSALADGGARILDHHVDADHNRCVFTVSAAPGKLAGAVAAGGARAVERIDMRAHQGVHPCVGALDVAPVVHLTHAERGAACAEALVLADELARLDLGVFLYGTLGAGRTRAQLRRGGLDGLAARVRRGELAPDIGRRELHPSAGAALVAARPPLVAFNVELAAPASLETAREVAAAVREGGPRGLVGLRAIGVWLDSRDVAQVSCNVEAPRPGALRDVVTAVRELAPVAAAELVGLAPSSAMEGFPGDVSLPGFDPERQLIERALERE